MHVEIAEQMRSGAKQCSGVQQLIIESFANALETIPTILAKNGGFNASKIIAQLRNLHSTKGNEWMGVDMTTGSVNNMITTRVIEPTSIMLNALKSAVDATEMILRIDQNVFLKPGKTLEELGIM
jgi:T-complex protein 1 subunit eta